jgi:hypothetical protein
LADRIPDLSGRWSGEFAYPQHMGPVTPFVAQIDDRGGRLAGTIIEVDPFHGAVVEALIVGSRHGIGVDFIKSYDAGAPDCYANPVDYVGSLSADGNTVTGVWSLLELDGTFEMRREAALDEPIEKQEAEAIPKPVDAR